MARRMSLAQRTLTTALQIPSLARPDGVIRVSVAAAPSKQCHSDRTLPRTRTHPQSGQQVGSYPSVTVRHGRQELAGRLSGAAWNREAPRQR